MKELGDGARAIDDFDSGDDEIRCAQVVTLVKPGREIAVKSGDCLEHGNAASTGPLLSTEAKPTLDGANVVGINGELIARWYNLWRRVIALRQGGATELNVHSYDSNLRLNDSGYQKIATTTTPLCGPSTRMSTTQLGTALTAQKNILKKLEAVPVCHALLL